MKDPRGPSRFATPLLHVLAALASLAAGIACAAYLPEAAAMRVPLSLGGFATYVFFFRLAIHSVRRDLDAVWRDDGPALPPW